MRAEIDRRARLASRETVAGGPIPELHTAFATLARERPTGLLFGNDAFFVLRDLMSALAVRHAIPAVVSSQLPEA